jgi:hypothetical protein
MHGSSSDNEYRAVSVVRLTIVRRVVADLVGDLEHGHQAGVHADQVDLAAGELVRGRVHALQLPVVETVARSVVVGDAAALRMELQQPLARGTKSGTRPGCDGRGRRRSARFWMEPGAGVEPATY